MGMDGLAGWKRERVGAGRGGGDYGECLGDWEVRSMAYCSSCLVVSRSRLESSLRIPGQRRGGDPFQLQAGQDGRKVRGEAERPAEPRSQCGIEFEKSRAGMERMWRPRPSRLGGPARVSVLSSLSHSAIAECARRDKSSKCRDPERRDGSTGRLGPG